jgi:uroporphyrinogen III methyltransferase / synthase
VNKTASLHIALTANEQLNQAITEQILTARPDLKPCIAHYQVLKIEPIAPELAMLDYDAAIFVSQHAVTGALKGNQLVKELMPSSLFAIGSKTAETLNELGYSEVMVPEQFNSESLLAHPALQAVAAKDILLVKGEGGRTLIAETLTARGARVVPLEVYRRQALIQQLNGLVNNNIIALAPSIDALASFQASLKTSGVNLNTVEWVSISDRISNHLKTQQLQVVQATSLDAKAISSAILAKADTITVK